MPKHEVTIRVRVDATSVADAVQQVLGQGVAGEVVYFNAEEAHEWSTDQVPVNLAEPPPMRDLSEIPREEPTPGEHHPAREEPAPKKTRRTRAAKAPEPEAEVTREMIHARAAALLQMKGSDHVADVLKEFGAARLSLIPEESLAQAYEKFGREVDSAAN